MRSINTDIGCVFEIKRYQYVLQQNDSAFLHVELPMKIWIAHLYLGPPPIIILKNKKKIYNKHKK